LDKCAKRVGALDTSAACRLALARLYREARSGKLETADGTRFANVLIGMIRDSDLEAQL
jgi:hypothetical protein